MSSALILIGTFLISYLVGGTFFKDRDGEGWLTGLIFATGATLIVWGLSL